MAPTRPAGARTSADARARTPAAGTAPRRRAARRAAKPAAKSPAKPAPKRGAKAPTKRASKAPTKRTAKAPPKAAAARPARAGGRGPAKGAEARHGGRTAPAPASPPGADWRQATLERVRALVQEADPDAVEEVKWRKPSNPAGVPTWFHGGILLTGETYKDKVKLTFAHGAALPDPKGLFNASLDAGTRRAIDVREGSTLDAQAFRDLVRAAAGLNLAARA